MYRTRVSYSYRYNHVAYIGIHATLSSSTKPMSKGSVRSFGKTYQNGATVQVHVDPQNPSQSALSPGGREAWFLWAVAAGFAAASYYVAMHG